jgi:hypothetical protein
MLESKNHCNWCFGGRENLELEKESGFSYFKNSTTCSFCERNWKELWVFGWFFYWFSCGGVEGGE